MHAPTRRARKTLAIAAAATLAVSLSGCSIVSNLFPKPVTRDSETEEVVEGGQASVFTIKVGDCITDPGNASEVTDIEAIPCSESHDYEAYYEFSLDGTDYPGDDEIGQLSDDGCYEQFQGFVGTAYEDSTLEYFPFTPTEGSWTEQDDRLVTCMIGDPAGKVTGSLKGVAH